MHLPAQLGIQRRAKVLRGLGVSYGFAIHNYRYMMILLLVKVTWIDLSSLSLISHCQVQLFISSAALCNSSVASTSSPPMAMMAVSSAKFATVVPSGCGRSLMYRR